MHTHTHAHTQMHIYTHAQMDTHLKIHEHTHRETHAYTQIHVVETLTYPWALNPPLSYFCRNLTHQLTRIFIFPIVKFFPSFSFSSVLSIIMFKFHHPKETRPFSAFSLPALFYSFCLPPEGSTLHLHVAAHSAVLEPAASPVSWYRRSLLPKFSSYPCSIVPLLTHLSFGHEALKFGGRLCLWHKCCVTLFPQSCIFLRDHYICFNHMDFKSVHVFGFLIIFPTFTRVRCAICVWFLVFASLLTLSLGPKGGNDRWR